MSIGFVSHYFRMRRFCLFFVLFSSNHSFCPYCHRFFTFPCLCEISFSGQMISITVSSLLGLEIGSSSDHIIILAVRRRS